LSQAIVYVLNAQIIKPECAMRLSSAYGLAWLTGLLGVAVLATAVGGPEIQGFDHPTVWAIAVASAGLLLNGLYRAICLATRPILIFNLVSILPAFLTLALFLIWSPESYQWVIWALAVGSLISGGVAAFWLRQFLTQRFSLAGQLEPVRKAMVYGLWSFIPNIAVSLNIAGTYMFLRHIQGSDVGVGNFSIAYLIISTTVLPLNMVIPVLFDIWSKDRNPASMLPLYARLSHLGTVLTGAGMLGGWLLVTPVILFVFGAKFADAAKTTQWLLLSLYALFQNRLLYALALSLDHPRQITVASIIKTLAIFLPIAVGWVGPSLNAVAAVWIAGEWFSMLYLMAVLRSRTCWSLAELSGLSPRWFAELARYYGRR
jgi:O-antigen/teichoic acid export membrane protein